VVTRGEVWWLELEEYGRRPALVLTRDAAIPVRRKVMVAPLTDAAAGGPHGGFERAPILLTTDSDTLSDATRRWLEEHRDTIESIDVLGTSDVVPDAVVQEARSAATAP